MITVSKDGREQLLSFGEEYWYRKWKDNANDIFQKLSKDPPVEPITGETWWEDWKRITQAEYDAYIKIFTKERKDVKINIQRRKML